MRDETLYCKELVMWKRAVNEVKSPFSLQLYMWVQKMNIKTVGENPSIEPQIVQKF
jgi:hypothetical protein